MVPNDADKESCVCCESPKPGSSTAKKAPSSSAFDNPGKANAAFAVTPGGGGGFKFGAAATTTSTPAGGGFTFGGGGGTASTGYVTACRLPENQLYHSFVDPFFARGVIICNIVTV